MLMKVFIMCVMAFLLGSCAEGGQTKPIALDFEEQALDSAEFSPRDVDKIVKFVCKAISENAFFQSSAYLSQKSRWMLDKEIKNDTDEHIDTRMILEKIRTTLIRQNGITFVDDMALRDILKVRKMQESDLFNPGILRSVGQLAGADVVLQGRIANIRRREIDKEMNRYLIAFQLVALTTSKVLWMDELEIVKKVPRRTTMVEEK